MNQSSTSQLIWNRWVHYLTYATHGLILAIFFCATWWWRPRWAYAEWVPDFFRERLGYPSNTQQYLSVYYIRFTLVYLVIILGCLWALTMFKGLRELVLDGRIWWAAGLVGLSLYIRLSVGWADQKGIANSQAIQWMLVTIFALVVTCNGPQPRWVALALAGGAIFHAALAITQSALQHEVNIAWIDQGWLKIGLDLVEYRRTPDAPGVAVVQANGVRFLRAYGLTSHPNPLAGGLVVGLIASVWLWLKAETRRTAAWVTTIILWGLLLTFSRSGMGSLAVGLIATCGLFFLNQNLKGDGGRGIAALGVMLALIAGTFYIGYRPLIESRAGEGNEGLASVEDISTAARQILKDQARQIFRDHRWTGIGVGNFPWESQKMIERDPRHLDMQGTDVHNVYYLILAELGIVGAAFASWILIFAAGLLWIQWREQRLTPEAVCLWGAVGAWLAVGWYDYYYWVIFTHQIIFWGVMAAALTPIKRAGNIGDVEANETN
ncbi:MAG: O-antigen ligase family protein [Chloroflexi bacterium]|nr:O-antigen ligase family protein [Chloroflexota bacterium]